MLQYKKENRSIIKKTNGKNIENRSVLKEKKKTNEEIKKIKEKAKGNEKGKNERKNQSRENTSNVMSGLRNFLDYGGEKEFVVKGYVNANFDTNPDDSE